MVNLKSIKLPAEDWIQIIQKAQVFGLAVFDNLNQNFTPPLKIRHSSLPLGM